MPSLQEDEARLLQAYEAFVTREDVARETLDKGECVTLRGVTIRMVEYGRRRYTLGGCGNSVGLRAVIIVSHGKSTREIELGPGPTLAEFEGRTIALDRRGSKPTICLG